MAQNATGSNNGSSCGNAYAVTFFNTSGNWGAGATQIGPGTTVHLCGTITGAAGATGLTFQGSGSAGNPITLLFEANAQMSAPYWHLAIDMSGKSYVAVDGGSNGIVQNTANGDLLPNRQATDLIVAAPCNNCTVKNLSLINAYIHVQGSPNTNIDQNSVRALYISGSNWLVTNNVIHDCGWCVEDWYGPGDTQVVFSRNDIHDMDHGIALGPGTSTGTLTNVFLTENKIHDMASWDCTNLGCHHDGVHIFADPSDRNTITGLYVSNNYFYGNMGTTATGHVYVEGGTSPAHVVSSYWWNNVFEVHSNNEQNTQGWVGIFSGSSQTVFVNNTMMGEGYNDISFCYGFGYDTMPLVFKNNVGSRCAGMVTFNHATGAATDINYNYYGQSCNPLQTYNNCFYLNGSFLNSFAGWQSASGWDANSVSAKVVSSYTSSSTLFNPDGSPQASAPVIAAGVNLSNLATGPMASLAFDTTKGGTRTATPRSATGAWDIGAYAVGSSSGSVTPPTPPSAPTSLSNTVK